MICNASPKIPGNVDEIRAAFIQGFLCKNPAKRVGFHEYIECISRSEIEKMSYELGFERLVTKDDPVRNFGDCYTEYPGLMYKIKDFRPKTCLLFEMIR